MQRVIVTGGSGFIGTNLVEHFAVSGAQVVNLDIAPPRNPAHSPYWSRVDLLDHDSLQRALSEFSPDLVFNMAARTDLDGTTIRDYAVNTEGVRNVIEAAAELPNLKRVVFASSMLVCRLGYRPLNDTDYNPTTVYGASKIEGERLVRDHADNRFSWTIVRPTSLWGPWFGVPYRNFFDAVRAGWYVHPRGLAVRRSYGFVLNSVVQLNRLATAAECAVGGRTFYLADYVPVELRAWSESIRSAFAAPCIREVPLWILDAAGRVGDALKALGMSNPPLTTVRLRNLTTEATQDIEPLEKVCGPIPYDAEKGVKITVEWIRQRV